MTALGRHWYDAAMVTVDGVDGNVRLGGSVRIWHERCLAERAAWAAPGVSHVVDNIAII